MNFVRKSVLVLITPIFILLLFTAAFDMGVLRVVSQPTNVKQILRDSGVYNNAVSSLLDQAKQQTSDDGSLDLTSPTVKTVANATITPQYVQTQTESFIDSVYAWLNGQTAQPDFQLDVGTLKDQFAANLSKAVEQQAAALPACPDAASASAALNDPVAATCLPAGVTPTAIASEVQGDILGGKGFLDNTTIDASSIKSNQIEPNDQNSNNQKSIFAAQLKDAPKQYQKVKKTPIILSILALLAAIAVVFLSSSRRKGLRHAGILLLGVGLFMLLFAWGLNDAVVKEVPKINLNNNAVLSVDVRKVIIGLSQQIDRNYWIFGAVYTALGVLAIAAALIWKDKDSDSKAGLKGEGKTEDDRIDLKAPDKAADVDKMQEVTAPPAKKAAKPAAAKPAAKAEAKSKD